MSRHSTEVSRGAYGPFYREEEDAMACGVYTPEEMLRVRTYIDARRAEIDEEVPVEDRALWTRWIAWEQCERGMVQ